MKTYTTAKNIRRIGEVDTVSPIPVEFTFMSMFSFASNSSLVTIRNMDLSSQVDAHILLVVLPLTSVTDTFTPKRVVNLYSKSGYSTRRIAQTMRIDRQRVSEILRRKGIEIAPRGAGRRRPLRVEGAITEGALRYLYVDCLLSSVEIGRALGISDRLVRSRLNLWEIQRRTRGQFNRFDRRDVAPDDLRPLYVEKEWPAAAAAAVGEELGVSGNVVLRSAHSGGLPVVQEAFLARLRRTIFC
jgi:hypothetical protein